MKKSTKKNSSSEPNNQSDLQHEGMVNMLIGLNTFPVDSEEELVEQKRIIEELKKLKEINNNNNS